MREFISELTPSTLPVVAAEAGRQLCEGCDRDECYCQLVSDEIRHKFNEPIEPEKFIATVRGLTRVVRVHARNYELSVPDEFIAIRKMGRATLLKCLAYNEFTNGQVMMWDGEVREKLYYTHPRRAGQSHTARTVFDEVM